MGAPIPPQAGFYNVDHPELEGLECQVQRGNQAGVPDPGLVGVGVIIGPDGQPRVLLQMKHADGESLISVLRVDEFFVLAGCMAEVAGKAGDIARRAQMGGRA
jgi:hypothetical protein